MEWYWIVLIVVGSIAVLFLITFPFWCLFRLSSIVSRQEEKMPPETLLDERKENGEK